MRFFATFARLLASLLHRSHSFVAAASRQEAAAKKAEDKRLAEQEEAEMAKARTRSPALPHISPACLVAVPAQPAQPRVSCSSPPTWLRVQALV